MLYLRGEGKESPQNSTNKMDRRKFLRWFGKGALVTVATASGLSLILCGKNPPEDHVTYHELFNDSVKITRTETTQRSMWDNLIRAVKLDFEINQPGNYLFEGWVENYRSNDTLGEKWEYQVSEAPYKEGRDLHSSIYRLEATRVGKDGKIERDTEEFRHHGRAGSLE